MEFLLFSYERPYVIHFQDMLSKSIGFFNYLKKLRKLNINLDK